MNLQNNNLRDNTHTFSVTNWALSHYVITILMKEEVYRLKFVKW